MAITPNKAAIEAAGLEYIEPHEIVKDTGPKALNLLAQAVVDIQAKGSGSGGIVSPGRPDMTSSLDPDVQAQVAAATVGTDFYSTDGAGVGAWVWRKRPTGWVVTDGDTGWRNVTELTADPTAFRMWLRRTGSEVIGYVSVDTDTSESSILAIPIGFRPTSNPWGGAHASAAPVGVAGRMAASSTTLYLSPENSPKTLTINSASPAPKRGYARWTTMDAWPTTLPGTPA